MVLKTRVCYKSRDKNVLGDVVYHDVVILSSGTWNQQDAESQIYYPPDVCSRDAENWKRSFIYHMHTKRVDGTPIDSFNIVGMVDNKRFDYIKNAIIGDLRIIPITQNAKDVIKQIDRGIIKYLSPEIRTWDKYNYFNKRREVSKLEFNGVALVIDSPACKTAIIDPAKKTITN